MILGYLHRSRYKSSNFTEEIKFIPKTIEKTHYPKHFIYSVARQIQDKSNQCNLVDFDDYIVPSNFFDIPKPFILIEFNRISFCENSEINSNHFLKKFNCFSIDRFEVYIKWKTRQVKTLFPLKHKSIYPSCVIYKHACRCGETHIGEIIRNPSVR